MYGTTIDLSKAHNQSKYARRLPNANRIDTLNILQLGQLFLPGHSALDQTVRVRLRSIHLGVFAGVLETFVPAQVCEGG